MIITQDEYAKARYLHILNKAIFDSTTIETDVGYSPELLGRCITHCQRG